jgi:hypothetical protein
MNFTNNGESLFQGGGTFSPLKVTNTRKTPNIDLS